MKGTVGLVIGILALIFIGVLVYRWARDYGWGE